MSSSSHAGWDRTYDQPGDWKTRAARIHRQHRRTCHLCGHGQADEIDHVIPRSQGGTHADSNLRPIHGAPCPTCGRRCHSEKTSTEIAAGKARRSRRRPTDTTHPGLTARSGGG